MRDFAFKMHQIQFWLGLSPRPCWGSSQRSPRPLSCIWPGKGEGKRGREEGKGRGEGKRKREGKEGREEGKGRKEGRGEEGREREGVVGGVASPILTGGLDATGQTDRHTNGQTEIGSHFIMPPPYGGWVHNNNTGSVVGSCRL